MSDDIMENYIPDKKVWDSETKDYKIRKVTPEDSSSTVIINGHPRPYVSALPYEFNREHNAETAKFVNVGTLEAPHYSKFDGHFVTIDIDFKARNERNVNDFKGFDDVRKYNEAIISFDTVVVGHIYHRGDPLAFLLNIHQTVKELLAVQQLIDHIKNRELLDGRKIFYRDQPATITSFNYGRVSIKPDNGRWIPPAWRSADHISQSDLEEEVVTEITSPLIFWWRD